MQHTLHKLSPHVWWFTPNARTDRPILGAVVGERATLMVDAGASPDHADAFLAALAREEVPPPTYLALTHWHWDHVFGMASLDAPLIAQRGTAVELEKLARFEWSDAALDARVEAGLEIAFCRDMIKLELPEPRTVALRPPDIIFEVALTLDLGGVTCELHHVGGDHAADSSVLYVLEDKVLFLGDAMSQAIYSPEPYYSAANTLALFDTLGRFDAEAYLESHNENVLSKEAFQGISRTLCAAAEVAEQIRTTPADLKNALEHHPDVSPEDLDELVTLFGNGLKIEQLERTHTEENSRADKTFSDDP